MKVSTPKRIIKTIAINIKSVLWDLIFSGVCGIEVQVLSFSYLVKYSFCIKFYQLYIGASISNLAQNLC